MSFPARPERQGLNGLCRSRFLVNFSTLCYPAQGLRLISQQTVDRNLECFVEKFRASASHS